MLLFDPSSPPCSSKDALLPQGLKGLQSRASCLGCCCSLSGGGGAVVWDLRFHSCAEGLRLASENSGGGFGGSCMLGSESVIP